MVEPNLPSCCSLVAADGKLGVSGIDFWTALPSGDDSADYERGDRYAVEVMRYATETGQSLFVDCVIMSMTMVLYERCGTLEPGRLERSFLNRIRQDDPAAIARLARRVAAKPHRLN